MIGIILTWSKEGVINNLQTCVFIFSCRGAIQVLERALTRTRSLCVFGGFYFLWLV